MHVQTHLKSLDPVFGATYDVLSKAFLFKDMLRTVDQTPTGFLALGRHFSERDIPGLSGIDLAIQLRKYCPDCKVLLFPARQPVPDSLSLQGVGDVSLRFS
jgi:hypothetical protein